MWRLRLLVESGKGNGQRRGRARRFGLIRLSGSQWCVRSQQEFLRMGELWGVDFVFFPGQILGYFAF